MLKMLLFIICEPPQRNSTIFKPFLTIFTLFHLKNLQLCKIFPSYIYGTPQVMFGLVNNHGKWCQMSCVIFHDWTFLVGMCVECGRRTDDTQSGEPDWTRARLGDNLNNFLPCSDWPAARDQCTMGLDSGFFEVRCVITYKKVSFM